MTTLHRSAAAAALVAALVLVGCGSSDSDGAKSSATTTTAASSTTAKSSALEITDVWARTSPMATTTGAVYLTITSPVDDSLIKAEVPTSVAKTTEIHETVAAGGGDMSTTTMAGATTTAGDMTTTTAGDMASTTAAGGDMTGTTAAGGDDSMTMRPVDSIELPAGETVKLEPGGYHIMLLDLVKPLAKGDKVQVTLTFDKAGTKTVTATVRDA